MRLIAPVIPITRRRCKIKGAEQGDALAAFKLARLLSAGQIEDNAYGKSGPWDVKACELGQVVGCHNAGVGHQYGKSGLAKDDKLARSFYLKAAERGYAYSQYNLGSMYADRYFQDDNEGYRWMMIARISVAMCAAEEDETCQWLPDDPPEHVKHLAERLSQSDREAIEAAARDWKPVSD